MKLNKTGCFLLGVSVCGMSLQSGVIGFEDIPVLAGSFLNNASGGVWESGGAEFPNTFTDLGGGVTFWNGFAISAMTGSVISPADLAGRNFLPYQYQVPSGAAFSGSRFGVGYVSSFGSTAITLPVGLDTPLSMAISNSLYTWAAMTYGDPFSRQFGGETGMDPDYFILTIQGLDINDVLMGSVEVVLADFRDPANAFIVADWLTVDLSSLGSGIARLDFEFESSDIGMFGVNTPTYFAMDDLVVIPEPAAALTYAGLVVLSVVLLRRRRRAA
ncbi:MAG: DUF4465 domain-containing protein [Verrucomicrobia bacterium]|nr:DUF4465 domain-containing protein [Verrucomicrobiota bacterium]